MKKYESEEAGIYLRLMTYDDTDTVVRWRNNPEVSRYFIYQGPFTKEIHENWIRTKVETGKVVQFIICAREDDKPLGSVYLRDIDEVHRKAEYGIFIGEDSARGRGIGTATAKLMLQYAFEELGLHRVYLRVLGDNTRAFLSYEKAGFRQEGILMDDVFLQGRFQTVIWMAAINPGDML